MNTTDPDPTDVLPPFERVVAHHGPTVLRVCRAVLGPVDADDAWSETFLSALRAYPDLPPGSNVEAWLVTIAHRKALDHVRARTRRAVPVPEVREQSAGTGPAPPPGSVVDQGLDPALVAALAGLTERQRQAVAYHHVGGLPYAEVALLLGGSPAAVRRAAADGMRTLRTRLTTPPRTDTDPFDTDTDTDTDTVTDLRPGGRP